jgi:hypothetical protein
MIGGPSGTTTSSFIALPSLYASTSALDSYALSRTWLCLETGRSRCRGDDLALTRARSKASILAPGCSRVSR